MAEHFGIACEVAYARPDRQFVVRLELRSGSTVQEAVSAALDAGLRGECPEIVPEEAVLGIFGKVVPRNREVREGDRIEIYRPLRADPRIARRARVKAARAAGR